MKNQNSNILAFSQDKKSKAPDIRKKWLAEYDRSKIPEQIKKCYLDEFVNKELIHYSNYSCERAIPNMVDGYKKHVKLYIVLKKKNLRNEVKVNNLR